MPGILKHTKRRVEAGKSSIVTFEGRKVDPAKIRRALKEEKRATIDAIQAMRLRNRIPLINGRVLPFTNNL